MRGLAEDLAAALAVAPEAVSVRTLHITVVSYTGLEPPGAAAGARARGGRHPAVHRARFTRLWHLHLVSGAQRRIAVWSWCGLDELHGRVHASPTRGAGQRGLRTRAVEPARHRARPGPHAEPPRAFIEVLAHRPHRTWSVSVAPLTIASRHGDPRRMPATLAPGDRRRADAGSCDHRGTRWAARARRFQPMSRAMLNEDRDQRHGRAGSSTSVVNVNASSTITVVAIATASRAVLAPVSSRTRR